MRSFLPKLTGSQRLAQDKMAPAQSPAWRKQFRTQFKKTKLCRFNAVGQCHYGKECAFAHGLEDLERPPDLTKTALCPRWQEGYCPLPPANCPYAHGPDELRLTPAFSRAKFSNRTKEAAEAASSGQQQDVAPPGRGVEGDDARSEQGSTRCGSFSLESGSTRSQESPRPLTGGAGSQQPQALGGALPLNLDMAVQAQPDATRATLPAAAHRGHRGHFRRMAPGPMASSDAAESAKLLAGGYEAAMEAFDEPPPPPGLLLPAQRAAAAAAAAAAPWPTSAPIRSPPGPIGRTWPMGFPGPHAVRDAAEVAAFMPPPQRPYMPPTRQPSAAWSAVQRPPPQQWQQVEAGQRLPPPNPNFYSPAYVSCSGLLTEEPSGRSIYL